MEFFFPMAFFIIFAKKQIIMKELLEILENKINSEAILNKTDNLYGPINYAMHQGGKRIRPLLCMMAYNGLSKDKKYYNEALDVALGMEILHNFTLLHDDIMDNSPLRRKRPTVWKVYGQNAAILSGDCMQFVANQFVLKAPDEYLAIINKLFVKTSIEICEGQQFDMDFEQRDEVSLDEYLEMIRLKTAVLPASCMQMGAILAGQESDLLYKSGILMGLAFQIQDDILDCYSTEEKLGKPIGGDIIENKHCILTILAKQQVEDKLAFNNLLKDNSLAREEKISKVRAIYDSLNIKQQAKAMADNYMKESLDILYSIKDADLKVMIELFEQIKNRDY